MKMHQSSFAPISPCPGERGALDTSAQEETIAREIKRDRACSKKLTSLNFELAVELMLSVRKIHGDTMRQKYRLNVIKALPADAIDLAAIHWTQV